MKKGVIALLTPALLLVFAGMVSAQWPPELIGTIEGNIAEDRNFGDKTCRIDIGDMNGDGYTDLIVAAYGNDLVRIFFGDDLGIDPDPDVTLQGPDAGTIFGCAVSVGDLNNDGYDDVVVGAPLSDLDTVTQAGKAYAYLGGSPMDTIADLTLVSEHPIASGWFGWSLQCLNFEGDPYADVFVTAGREHVYGCQPVPYPGISSAPPTYSGITYLFRGGGQLNAEADLIIPGETSSGKAGEGAGMDVADVNGDGYDDLLVDAYGAAYNFANLADYWGKVNLYLGGKNLDFGPDIRIPKQDTTEGAMFGYIMSNGGDVNGDGNDDLLVGRHAGGRFYVYFGPLRCLDPDVTIEAPPEADATSWTKFSINELGDINNDGYDDFVVSGAYENWEDGIAYIFLGGETIGDYLTLACPDTGYMGLFSWASAPLGDITGDGIDDFLISATNHGDSLQGKLYLYAGNAGIGVGVAARAPSTPSTHRLLQNYPNPFNPETEINFNLPKATKVTLEIYNKLGQKIRTLLDEEMSAGFHSVYWDSKNASGELVASGVYFYRIVADGYKAGKKMLLVR